MIEELSELIRDSEEANFDDECFRAGEVLTRDSEDWPDLADSFRELWNQVFDEEIEEHSKYDDMITAAVSSGYYLAMRHICKAMGIEFDELLMSHLIECQPSVPLPTEWRRPYEEWQKLRKELGEI